MCKTEFCSRKLDALLTRLPAVNVTDPEPDEACKFLVKDHENAVGTTSSLLMKEMMKAITGNSADAYRRKTCEAPFLAVIVTREDCIKTALQQELVFILNVRQYHKRPTVLVSEEPMSGWDLTNESLAGYVNAHDGIRTADAQ